MGIYSKSIRVFSFIKKALRGQDLDFTKGSIDKAIFLLAIPMVLEMLMESLFAVADAFYVSQLNSNEAVSIVGVTESVLTLVYSMGFGVSMGATAMVARRVGEKDFEKANKVALQAIYIGVGISVVIGILGFVFAGDILYLVGRTHVSSGINYTRWMFAGNITILLLFIINGVFRGAGVASLAMTSLWLSNGLNIILDPIFIFGFGPVPAFGVEGAAIATNIGRGTAVVLQLYFLIKGKKPLKIDLADLKIQWVMIKRIVVISAGGAGQFIIASCSWIFLMSIIGEFGEAAKAGYTIAIRVIIFAILPAWGMANAAATLVGQNLGAKQPDRAEKSVWHAAGYNMAFLGLVTVFFLIFARQVINLFGIDAEATEYAVTCLNIVCLGYVFYAFSMVLAQSFNGAGDTRTPTILNLVGFWVLQIPMAYVFAKTFGWGPTGVFSAIAIAESILAVISVFIFRLGRWKATQV